MKIVNSKIELNKDDFSFVCPMKTESMSVVKEGYFCEKCEKKVHDVSTFTEEEFSILKASNNNLCVTFKKVAVVSLALSFVACSSAPSSHTTGKISLKEPCQAEVDKKAIKDNRLRPFKVADKNKTIKMNHSAEIIISGEMRPIEKK
jgi:hypothetical protein